ncbi:MAG: hypothetical protein HOG18_01090 [Proteobacteria bacterium]|nr:hypothetical protein [Pseudomonadota bacterium]MDB4825639.1 hypothetical protein [Gammaproteobacteria bacterium]MBT4107717.1 hypothetical protein [Pseudomonadota bacterium]MBT4357419.1 hypothetical protein [Pseudomonadota bacterium]MBT4987526.1 hypothetical protein [Pseudomonadota bacterium]
MDRIILVLGLSALVFLSPILSWWLRPALPWYLAYLLWLLIIVMIPWAHSRLFNR